MNKQTAITRLTNAGYVATASGEDSRVTVQDPFMGYLSGKFAVDGYNTVMVSVKDVSKFIEDRK